MNKKDLIPVILLALLIPVWMVIDRTFIAPKFPAKTPVPAEQPAGEVPAAEGVEESSLTEAAAGKAAETLKAEVPAVTEPTAEEIVVLLENAKV